MSFGIVASVGGAIVGGVIASKGAKSAANTQAAASDRAVAENSKQMEAVRKLLQPYVGAGNKGLQTFMNLGGFNRPVDQRLAIDRIRKGPEFAQLARQGEEAILANASATGGLRGGNTQEALADSRTNLLYSLIERQLGRSGDIMRIGQNSAAGVGTASLATGNQNAQLIQQAGAAQAGGTVAASNALASTVGGIGGILGSQFGSQQAAPVGPPPNPFYTPGFGTGTVAPATSGAAF